MQIFVYASDEAAEFIRRKDVLDGWQRLYDQCAWGTSLQSSDFVTVWYDAYRTLFAPLVVAGYDADNTLVGLLTLAVSKTDDTLVVAGSNQAEYHVWLATPESNDEFIVGALAALRERFPNGKLRFLFLPPNAPLQWLERDATWSAQSDLRMHSRGLMRTGDADAFRQSLKKKSNKSRLKRLERHGAISFEHLTSAEQLAEVFDEIITYGTFRLSAVHNAPVARDPFKKDFYLAMMRRPRLVHATVLRVGERLAAAHVGHYNKDSVLLGIITHAPFFAEHSPGKLLLLMLGIELAEEGVPVFDLTPGGEYKDRFATDADTAYAVDIFFNRAQFRRYKAKRKLIGVAKRSLQSIGVSRDQAAEKLHVTTDKLRRVKPATIPAKVFRRVKHRIYDAREFRVYTFGIERVGELSDLRLMQRDNIEDLLAYKPVEAWQPPVSTFMREALERLSTGCHVYTRAENDTLLHYGWLIERQAKSYLSEVGQDFYPLADSALLFDYYSHPQARGKGLYRASLCQMLRDAAQIPGTKRIYISVLADNYASRHVIEKVGFIYEYSFYSQKKLWKTRRWSDAPEEVTRPRDAS